MNNVDTHIILGIQYSGIKTSNFMGVWWAYAVFYTMGSDGV